MRNFTQLIAFCSLLLALASCGKEKSVDTLSTTPGGSSGNGNGNGNGSGSGSGGGTSNGSEVGNWKFITMHAITSETIEFSMGSDAIKLVTTSDYTTDNNSGNVKFDGTTMFTNDVAFSVNSTAKTAMYTNGVLLTSQNAPFAATMPATTSTTNYKKIATDSLYFAAGVMSGLDPNGSVTTKPGGYKLKWDGDKMYMTMNYAEITNEDDGMGNMQKITTKVTTVTTVQKQ
jgi:hypothetical protein